MKQTKQVATAAKTKTRKSAKAVVHTSEDYAKLAKRFSNKQIATFWHTSLKSIASYAGNARRKGLIS